MVIPGFGVLRNATPVVAWFGLSSHPIVAGLRAPDGPAAVVAGLRTPDGPAAVVAGFGMG
jgi:hypothetical protein